MSFWVGAHDIGKVTPCFQYRVNKETEEIKKKLEREGFAFGCGNKGHQHTGTKILREVLLSGGGSKWQSVDIPTANCIAVAVGGHHGIFPSGWNNISLELGGDLWAAARQELLGQLARVFLVASLASPKPSSDDKAIWMFLAGMTATADWIGSNKGFFSPYISTGRKYVEPFEVDWYARFACGKADRALRELGWMGRAEATSRTPSFEESTGFAKPCDLQEKIVPMAQAMTEPEILVVEAPMGEGKTEAAWYVADCWDSFGGSGTYVALPTMATSNQMFDRVAKFLSLRPGKSNLQLHHGKSSLNPLFKELMDLSETYDNDASPSKVVAEEWFAKDKKQALLAPYGVGTIDQTLLAVLQTKHVFVRLFGLAGKCVILDEVHAYDAYMTTLMERLLAWLAALRCPVVLLSATLPADKRLKLIEAYAGKGKHPSADVEYPRITRVSLDGNASPQVVHVNAKPQKEIQLQWLKNQDLVKELMGALAKGGCAAVIRNTVGLAQITFDDLRKAFASEIDSGELILQLFHARFPFGQRSKTEAEVLKLYGKGEGGKPENPLRPKKAILVATQVVEQSLDLDFDVMFSDLAPVDLVLQRAGRLHRHDRGGRGNRRLWLIEPELDGDGLDFGPSKWVYMPYLLFKSHLALKRGSQVIQLPEGIDRIVQEVYSCDNPPEGLSEAEKNFWAVTKAEFDTRQHEEEDQAEIRQIKKPGFSGILERIVSQPREEDSPDIHPAHQALTRLSRPTVQLICLLRGSGNTWQLPHNRSVLQTLTVRPMSKGGIDDIRTLLNGELTVADFRVLRALSEDPQTLEKWSDVGMLCRHHLVTFEDGLAQIGNVELLLDEHLGLMVRAALEGDE